MLTPATLKRRLPTRQVCLRYGVSSRTVRRWEIQKVIPSPDFVVNERIGWNPRSMNTTAARSGAWSICGAASCMSRCLVASQTPPSNGAFCTAITRREAVPA